MYRNALFCGTLLVKNDEDTIMIQPKHYLRPTNLNEAWEALQQPSSFPLLGGALALGQLKLPYETIVDLQAIEELYTIEPSHEMLSLGSGLTLTQFINLPVPLTHQLAIRRTLPTNIRNNTSLLETWLVERYPAEWVCALMAHNPMLSVFTGDTDVEMPFSDWFKQRHGLPTLLHLSALPTDTILGSAHIARTPSSDPILCVAVRVTLDDAGQIIHQRSVTWGLVDGLWIEETDLPTDTMSITSNYLGTANYRLAMYPVLLRRAVADARAQLEFLSL